MRSCASTVEDENPWSEWGLGRFWHYSSSRDQRFLAPAFAPEPRNNPCFIRRHTPLACVPDYSVLPLHSTNPVTYNEPPIPIPESQVSGDPEMATINSSPANPRRDNTSPSKWLCDALRANVYGKCPFCSNCVVQLRSRSTSKWK